MNEIEQWLASGRDYALGVALYQQYGNNAALLSLFATPSNFAHKKLVEALSGIAETLRQAAKSAQQARETQAIQNSVAHLSQSLDNETVISIDKQAKSQYAQASFLHGQLRYASNDEERKALAFQILELFDSLSQGFETVDYYKEFGHLPPPPSHEEQQLQALDRAVLEKMRRNLIANISHARAGRKRAENIDVWQQRRAMIERILSQQTPQD
ncbi:hypothetical protein SAMN05421780_108190 [Flexibacter flexilis DSM 6793]|uniref:Uncharacterized protein n=1 Tax=Flexibacter flexilis DSM 6793 TaxID=927664 RepID=A0A1I1LE93_9BACT|nr:hypothetical protein [Flexibacter flexilis]SFC71276.1 hypothetical protein SAMN05421780_108190 [Flexibacter flexilis DSM 6793]